MAACTLDVGPRRVLVSEEGPPAAEFALFDTSDIELAPGEGGVLRESGYRTTAVDAARRLAVAGVTLDFAQECAELVHGRVAEAYARGPLVRRLVSLLGPHELFDGGTYDASLRRYEGTWLDLPLLANDAGIASATGVLHAAALAVLLSEVASDTPVVLTTLGHAESLRLGERTLRRHAVDNVAAVPRALRQLAEQPPAPQGSGPGPGREELAANIAGRLALCTSPEAREHLARLERALIERGRPSHGPLSDPEMWDAERMLGAGDIAAALRRVDAREAKSGREPATVYLRARAALLDAKESPRAIAKRIGEMAVSMSNFPEIELLAAQAWNAAGETRHALPFARDLVGNPRVPEELRAAAEAILRTPRAASESMPPEPAFRADAFERTEPDARTEEDDATPEPVVRRSVIPPLPSASASASERPPSIRVLGGREGAPRVGGPEQASSSSPVANSVPPPQIVVHDSRTDLPLSRTPSEPPRPRTLTPPAVPVPSSPTVKMQEVRRFLTPPERIASPLPPRTGQSSPPPPPVQPPQPGPERRYSSIPPTPVPVTPRSPLGSGSPPTPTRQSEPPPPTAPRPSGRVVQPEPWPSALRAPREERTRPEDIEKTPSRGASYRYMRGASLPPVVSEPPTAIPRAPVVPRVDIDEADLIETIPLPRGGSDANIEPQTTPRTTLEARVRFSTDARELARRYRREQGVELRLEVQAVPLLQQHLLERFPERVVTTSEDAREAELHGALLSELLARLFEAEWADISPTELGYWAMVVPLRRGAAKRVWPFGRVLRFIASGGEDDLVSFFRKLRELG
jgi:hypothetical protein